ncbi:polysaccharide deacetylase family protein [Telluribacter sp. SYSU D00476]|uniref:polysaccharide deacetylase family protein n=1 Tax=Telluribacter sp. SYSU D00476 TaxID=2811430 RepID=UPI001FF4ECC4|nr:polysaccharide deacetylase family protein [Telluribacter sp. SYSU D00476]
MFLHYSPFWLKAIFPKYLWHVPTREKKLYLTFDDGPIPDITEMVLDTLAQYRAKATFFCIGDNVGKHPAIYQKVLAAGHSVGNHTFNHLNGWKTEDATYLANIEKCGRQLHLPTRLFRPPYGRIKRSQARVVTADRQVVMWDVLSGDFSKEVSPQTCLRQTLRHTRVGSILLFHDSIKAAPNMQYAVPRILQHFSEAGYTFEALPMQ